MIQLASTPPRIQEFYLRLLNERVGSVSVGQTISNEWLLSPIAAIYLARARDALIAVGMVVRIIQIPANMTMTELMTTDGPNDHPGTREATSATAAAISPMYDHAIK